MALTLLMNAPATGVGPVVPGTLMPSGRKYVIDANGQINADPIDAGVLLGLGFIPDALKPGAGAIEVTDGTHTVTGATVLTFSGATVSGSTPNATATISGSGSPPAGPAGTAQLSDGAGNFSAGSIVDNGLGDLTFTPASNAIIKGSIDTGGGGSSIAIEGGASTGFGGGAAILRGANGADGSGGGYAEVLGGDGDQTDGPGASARLRGGNPGPGNGAGGDILLDPQVGGGSGRNGLVIIGSQTGNPLPTSDPSVANSVWADNGVLVQSGHTAPVSVGATGTVQMADGSGGFVASKFLDTSSVTQNTVSIADNPGALGGGGGLLVGAPGNDVSLVVQCDGSDVSADIEIDTYNTGQNSASANLYLFRSRGTTESASPVLNGDAIATIEAFGESGAGPSSNAVMAFKLLVNAESDFSGTPTSSIQLINANNLGWTLDAAGAFNVGSPSGPAPSAGDVNISGAYKVNGIIVVDADHVRNGEGNYIITDTSGVNAILTVSETGGGGNAALQVNNSSGSSGGIAAASNGTASINSVASSGASFSTVSRLDGSTVITAGTAAVAAVAGAATVHMWSGIVTSEALVAATTYTLTLTNSVIYSGSTVLVNAYDGTNAWIPTNKTYANGSIVIALKNLGIALTGAVVIEFAVLN